MPEDQAAKRPILEGIAEQTNAFLAELPDLDEEARGYTTHLEALERLSRAAPLEPVQLPSWALDPFREKDGRFDRIALLCADIEAWHIDELAAMDRHLAEVLPEGVHHVDSRLVFADLVGTMERDSRRLPLIALVVVLAFIAIDLRRVGPTLACFASLCVGLGLVVGVMGAWPIHLSFFNLVVMPAVIGLGIDASIHLWHGRTRAHGGPTNRATVVSALTTVVGFAGLLVAEHPGLRSIGVVGVLGICACVAVAFLALVPFRPRPPS
jgi:predicted exporter